MGSPSLLRLDIDILSVDHAFILLLLLARLSTIAAGSCAASLRSASRRSRFVHRLSQLVRSLREPLACGVHRRCVGAFECLFGIGQRRFHIATLAAGDLVSMLF